ncbi:glycoside hydrolase [Butyrivibrio sp.]|uniref:glycoside hydrolase n=1 Tax=Butyrivibrio sp. TaxID=28121 RepID=UPI0025DFD2FD|nr:glycoside hydrolase [Butyrivibrio sp.]
MNKKFRKIAVLGTAGFLSALEIGCAGQAAVNSSNTASSLTSASTEAASDFNSETENTYMDLEVTNTVKLSLADAQTFNDTNKDGYGEFQGFGTSLCWWANRVGYSDALTSATATAFFDKENGLGMTIGRYNIGGGDNVSDLSESEIESLQGENPYLHKTHIERSDSVVPGYCTDVTKIDLDTNSKEYYEENFERADFECGFAWNYDWDADKNQMNVLKAAADAAGDEFIAEAFSNSPPYFMTVSGCSSGGVDPSEDNLREDSYSAFATYMADVIEHWASEGVITFQSADPMNEPATSYWEYASAKQEGCHFSQGESQSKILIELNNKLKEKGLDIIICGTDETSIDAAYQSYINLSDEAKSIVTRIDTHAYQGTQRNALKTLAETEGKNLWMSEVDGTYSIGKEETGMQAALGFADEIIRDLNEMKPTAWIMWDAVDIHVDSTNEYDTCTRAEADEIINSGVPFWGIAIADHDLQELLLGQKYYAFGQFTRYIRPGYCIIGSSDNTVAAYNPEDGTIVIVAINTRPSDVKWEFDLSDFEGLVSDKTITATRTSGSLQDGESWADVTDSIDLDKTSSDQSFTAVLKGSSVTTFVIK